VSAEKINLGKTEQRGNGKSTGYRYAMSKKNAKKTTIKTKQKNSKRNQTKTIKYSTAKPKND
jgi:hypothetical protein